MDVFDNTNVHNIWSTKKLGQIVFLAKMGVGGLFCQKNEFEKGKYNKHYEAK